MRPLFFSELDPAVGDRFKFTGREWEASIGLYDYRARHYDPTTGRFINEDSWGISAGDPNFYRYVGNNPTDFIDPSGHVAASTYAAMVSGIIFTIVDVDFSCFTESGMVFSVGVGVPYTDVYQEVYSHEAKGGGIPTPAGIDVQIMSCALLAFAAWSNGVFAQFSTVLSLLSPSASDPPRDCTIYSDTRSYGSISDYSVFVRASCGGGDNPFYVANNDERIEIHTGYNDDPHSNCFIAGTHVLVVQPKVESEEQTRSQLAATDWSPMIIGLVGLTAALGVAKPGKKPQRNAGRNSSVDEFWSEFDPEPPGFDGELDEGPIELPLRGQSAPPSSVSCVCDSINETERSIQDPFSGATSESTDEIKTPSRGRLYRWALAAILMIACSLPFMRRQPAESVSQPTVSTPAYSTSIASKPIELIAPGDTVLAWDEELQREIPRKVLRVFRNTTDHIHQITITSSDGTQQTIGTTCTHPFWVVGEGWTDASLLEVGDPLREPGGQISRVSGHETEFSDEGIQTYNFEVEGSHTYFAAASASTDPVLVHNMSKRPRYGKKRVKLPANAKKLRLRKRPTNPTCDVDTPSERVSGSRAQPKRKPGTQGQMGNNQDENQRARAAANEAGLNKDQRKRFHREISGQGINDFETLKNIAQDIKDGLI